LSRIDIPPCISIFTAMLLVGIQVGTPRAYEDGGRSWRSAYGKAPVRGPVQVGRENLEGDRQADLRHHGGPGMAVLAYPEVHYAQWRRELGWDDIPYGAFAENFTVAGVSEEEACLGDVWRAGTALLQISQPRKPCRNISRFWRRPELLRQVQQTGRYGFYLRVLEEGAVESGQRIDLLERPNPKWTVQRATAARGSAARSPQEALSLLEVAELGDDWRAHVARALRRA
jgi:MOSC domain-containing protein YiiM